MDFDQMLVKCDEDSRMLHVGQSEIANMHDGRTHGSVNLKG